MGGQGRAGLGGAGRGRVAKRGVCNTAGADLELFPGVDLERSEALSASERDPRWVTLGSVAGLSKWLMRLPLSWWMPPLLQVYFHPADALSHASPDLSASLTSSWPGQPPLDSGERLMEPGPAGSFIGAPVLQICWHHVAVHSTYHDSLLPSLLHGRQTVSPSPPAGAACAAAYQLPSEPGKPVEEWSVADVQVWNGGGGILSEGVRAAEAG